MDEEVAGVGVGVTDGKDAGRRELEEVIVDVAFTMELVLPELDALVTEPFTPLDTGTGNGAKSSVFVIVVAIPSPLATSSQRARVCVKAHATSAVNEFDGNSTVSNNWLCPSASVAFNNQE